MDASKRANLVQKIINVIKEQLKLSRPSWFLAERIVNDVLEPEIQEVKNHYERLFYSSDDSNKH